MSSPTDSAAETGPIESGEEKRREIVRGIAKVLESAPLYRTHTYIGVARQRLPRSAYDTLPLPKVLVLFCRLCKQMQRWCSSTHAVSWGRNRFHEATYECKNCNQQTVTYFFQWSEQGLNGTFIKVGQDPALETDPPSELKLESADTALYKKALTCRNFSFGIGALAYLRRVVENRMNALLDLVAEAAKADSEDKAKWVATFGAELQEAKTNRPFDKKAEFAAKILPNHLKPGGHNPFDVLHGFASEGLHGKSDEDCLVTFDEVQEVFEYLFKQLTTSAEDAKSFTQRLAELAGKKKGKTR